MSKNLVIVESPAKAKTIEKFLGKDYHVLSSQGHIRDIDKIGKNSIGIDFKNGYAPHYVIDPQKHRLVGELKQQIKKSEKVWLASDEDREGEAIAWHLQQVLDLPKDDTNRIVFHEITKTAIQEAIAHPRKIDYNLVNAQQARRVVDRIVGYELSPVLWRKVTTGLSAGRVQSVAVRLIVEREREIEAFESTAQYRLTADFIGKDTNGKKVTLHTELNHRFSTREQAEEYLQQCAKANFSISLISHKPSKRTPAPPFTTSTLQQEAARKLKFTVSRTMRLAQALYEAGHITYMRTDSVNLSSLAIGTAKETIIQQYGSDYHQARQYHTSTKGAQEAHEAIRPTYIMTESAGENAEQKRLYDLIRKRTIASQMADAQIENTRIEVTAEGLPHVFVATGEVIVFDGFMRVYVQGGDEEETSNAKALPKMSEHTDMQPDIIQARQSFTKAPMRYTEASLVKRMEELGIGRPSTYATTIETIQQRKYVEKGDVQGKKRLTDGMTLEKGVITNEQIEETYGQDSQKLLPTDLGKITNDFLVEHFPQILSYDFTAKEEEQFDQIAEGKADWVQTVDSFYQTFHPAIEQVPTGKVQGRYLGDDPQSHQPVYAKLSKVGPCIQIGTAEGDKPRFASLKQGQSLYTITLEEALQLFDKPNNEPIMIDGAEAVIGSGRFGPYIRYNGQFYSIPKGQDTTQLTADDVRLIIQQHEDRLKPIYEWDGIQVLHGRFGPYIKTQEGNYRIPKSKDIDTLTEEEAQHIIATTEPTNSKKKK